MTEHDDEEALLLEIADKGGIGVIAFGVERLLSLSFTFVVTAGLGAVVYGYLSVLHRMREILDEVATGIASGHSRTIPRYDEDGERSILFASLVLIVAAGGVLGLAVVALREQIIEHTLFERRHVPTVLVFAAGLGPTVLVIYAASVFRAYRQVRRSVFVSRVARPGAALLGAVGAIAAGATGPTGVWLAVVTVLTIVAAGAVVILRRDTPMTADLKQTAAVRDFLTYVGGTSLVGLLGASQRQVVFVLMALLLSPVGAGVFSLSLLVGGIIRWPLKGINRALSAIASGLYGEGSTEAIERLYQQTSRAGAFLTIPVVVVVVPHARALLNAFSTAYGPGGPVLALVVVGQFLAVLAGSNGLLLLMTDNERPTAALHAVHVIVVLPLMILLAQRHGVVGLGVAYCFSIVFNNATELWLLRRLGGLRLLTRTHGLLAGVAVLTTVGTTAVAAVVPVTASIPVSALIALCVAALTYRWLLPTTDRKIVDVMLRLESDT